MSVIADAVGSPALEAQVRETARAIAVGRPDDAVPPAQRDARERYRRTAADDVVAEGYVGSDDMLWSSFLTRGAEAAEAVGRVSWADGSDEDRANGTGFLLGGDLVMTNNHVLWDAATAADCVLELDYEYGPDGRERAPRAHSFDPGRFFATSRELDYTVVALGPDRAGRPVAARRTRIRLVEQTGKVSNGEPLNVVHHPAGRRKTVTIRASHLQGLEGDDAAYTGDTLGGSSGAPIFNDRWELVALHFGGKASRDADGNPLRRDGGRWDSSMGLAEKAYDYNLGRRISRIVADLRATGTPPDVLDRLLHPGGTR